METTTLSPSALALFRLHVVRQGRVMLDDSTLVPYCEESVYRLTQAGFERKAELLACAEKIA